jgi:hypothetical protein
MSGAGRPEMEVFSSMGLCLSCIQQAEQVLQFTIETVLDDPTLNLAEQSEPERKHTLGDFLRKLKKTSQTGGRP